MHGQRVECAGRELEETDNSDNGKVEEREEGSVRERRGCQESDNSKQQRAEEERVEVVCVRVGALAEDVPTLA